MQEIRPNSQQACDSVIVSALLWKSSKKAPDSSIRDRPYPFSVLRHTNHNRQITQWRLNKELSRWYRT